MDLDFQEQNKWHNLQQFHNHFEWNNKLYWREFHSNFIRKNCICYLNKSKQIGENDPEIWELAVMECWEETRLVWKRSTDERIWIVGFGFIAEFVRVVSKGIWVEESCVVTVSVWNWVVELSVEDIRVVGDKLVKRLKDSLNWADGVREVGEKVLVTWVEGGEVKRQEGAVKLNSILNLSPYQILHWS